jgi:hypothetical protein
MVASQRRGLHPMGHPVMAAVLSTAIREMQSRIEKLKFDIL